MKFAKCCLMLVVWAALTLQARAQYPEIMPTMPAMPVIVETTPRPSPSTSPFAPTFGPRQMPENVYPHSELEPVFTPESEPPSAAPQRPYFPGQPPPALPSTPPAVSYLPESVPVRARPSFGQWLYAFFHPFRRTMTSNPMEQAGESASQVEMAAAAIRADELSAERRRTAIRYLAGVDGAFNPEAEAGLLTALRTDRHESVRYEAALALSNSCCWTAKTINALNQAMTGGTADGNPTERSDRVRQAAWQALSRCSAAIRAQPKQLPSQLPVSAIRRASFETSTAAQAPNNGSFRPGNAKSAPLQDVDLSTLPPLRPIGQVPDFEPPQPTYEPTPSQSAPRR